MFDHRQWTKVFVESPGYNDAAKYAFLVKSENPWKVIGIHRLTPEENQGESNIYVDCLNEAGRRAKSEKIIWDWDGRPSDKEAQPLKMDKPVREVPSIPIEENQVIAIWHPDGDSVIGIKADGSSSFFIVFQKMKPGHELPYTGPVLIEEPIIPVGYQLEYRFIVPERGEDQMKHLGDLSVDGWIAYSAAVVNGQMHHYLRRCVSAT
jgi:hypothetical protein